MAHYLTGTPELPLPLYESSRGVPPERCYSTAVHCRGADRRLPQKCTFFADIHATRTREAMHPAGVGLHLIELISDLRVELSTHPGGALSHRNGTIHIDLEMKELT